MMMFNESTEKYASKEAAMDLRKWSVLMLDALAVMFATNPTPVTRPRSV
jgi:hypothetical protein